MLAVELEFLFDDSEWFSCYFALDCPIEDIVWNLGDVIWEFVGWDNLFYFWKRGFIYTPVKSLFLCLFLSQRIIFLDLGFVVSIWT